MPDVFENIAAAPPPMLEMIAHVLELRASIPQQQEMQRTYLGDLEFPDGAEVLEIGCGTGAVARVLAAWPNVGHVLGVDPSPYLIERARALSRAPNLAFEVGDGRALDSKDGSFDVVILHTVLTHVQRPETLLGRPTGFSVPAAGWASAMATSRRPRWPRGISTRWRSASTRSSTAS